MSNRVDKKKVLLNAGGVVPAAVVNNGAGDSAVMRDLIANASLMRSQLLSALIDPRRDIDDECGYPKELTTQHYKLMYDREGVATRVVSLFPEESWAVDPLIYETEDSNETEFEKAWTQLEDERQLLSYMAKADELSGIGRYGLLLLGIDDGLPLHEPVERVEKGTAPTKGGKPGARLLYLRVFDESSVAIQSVEQDVKNPRFGKPTMYSITFDNTALGGSTSQGVGTVMNVHWTRVIHVADNRRTSEVYGTPRMQTLFNRLYDLRKVAGGSGEMFWKGGFPGYSFEMDSDARPLDSATKAELRDEVASYANGLQRYLTLQGVQAKSLTPQVADPKSHIEIQITLICIALGVPSRIFQGSEQAKLASSQDSKNWSKRITRRQTKYLTPFLIRPVVDRLIEMGVLPVPGPDGYKVDWPSADSPSDMDKAEVMAKQVEAFSKYVGGNVDQLIPPEIFLTMFGGLTMDEVQSIMKAVEQRERDLEDDERHLDDELNNDDDDDEGDDEGDDDE